VARTDSRERIPNLVGTRRALWAALGVDLVGLTWALLLRGLLGCDPLRAFTPVAVVPMMLGAVLGISSAARAPLRALGLAAFAVGIVSIGVTIAATAGLRSC
jgi:hypothetical protein